MSLAQRFERRLEGLVDGAFARVFKGQVEPVEVGTALQREAEDKRHVMPSGVVQSPNRYRVTLSPTDHERLAPWEQQLTQSLAELVQEFLDERGWTTIGDVEVYLARDDVMHTGVFGVASRMEPQAPPRRRPQDSLSLPVLPRERADPRDAGPPPPYPPRPGPPPDFATTAYPAQPPARPGPARPASHAVLVVDDTGARYELPRGSSLVGRGSEADLQLLDQGVSRRHARVQFDGSVARIVDEGSTNGTTVNGVDVTTEQLRHGDVIRVGHTRIVFQQFDAAESGAASRPGAPSWQR